MTQAPITAIVVGAGHRAMVYAGYALRHPDELKIVGVADPSELRRRQIREKFDFPADACFESAQELAGRGKPADVIINGTMDQHHVATTIPLLEAGYDVLLEKPFATNREEMWRLVEAARRCRRKVVICHVLRYAPFYAAIRAQVAGGAIGDVINVATTEYVSYDHMVVGYVRGKWNRHDLCGSTLLMSKSCHDLDLVVWMKSGIAPRRVASLGGIFQFRPDRAPEGAGTRCLVDCPIEPDCLYSARKQYIDHPDRWGAYVWDSLEHIPNPTIEQKIESLKTGNPYGRCVWKCDNDVVDHQAVAIEFEDGATATHTLVGGAARRERGIHLIGTIGEIKGCLEDNRFVLRRIDPRPGHEYSEETHDLAPQGDSQGIYGGHGGGDLRLVQDFLRVVRGEAPSLSTTTLEDSVYGHLVGFVAEDARLAHEVRPVTLPEISGSGA